MWTANVDCADASYPQDTAYIYKAQVMSNKADT